MFDLKQLSIDPDEQKEWYTLLDPRTNEPLADDEGKEVRLLLWGPDSHAIQKAETKFRAQQRSKAAKKGGVDMFSIGREINFERSVAAVAGWENLAFEGEEHDATDENVRRIFKAAPWIQEQVIVFILDRANFMES